VVMAYASWWTTSSVMKSLAAGGIAGPPAGLGNVMAVSSALFSAGFSLLYPLALLIVLCTKTARQHFNYIQTAVTGWAN